MTLHDVIACAVQNVCVMCSDKRCVKLHNRMCVRPNVNTLDSFGFLNQFLAITCSETLFCWQICMTLPILLHKVIEGHNSQLEKLDYQWGDRLLTIPFTACVVFYLEGWRQLWKSTYVYEQAVQVDSKGQYFTEVDRKGQGLTLQSPLY